MIKKRNLTIFLIITVLSFFLYANLIVVNGAVKPLKNGIIVNAIIGPVSPVEKVGQPNEKGYKATIIVKSKIGLKVVARFTTDDKGYYKVMLKPGTYILEPVLQTSPYPKASPVEAHVKANKFTKVVIKFESGIR